MKSRMIVSSALLAAMTFFSAAAFAGDIIGAGATFPYPIYAKWAEAYKTATGIGMNYQSIGSGGGIKQIKAGTVDFGASDKPLTPEELEASGLVQFPTVMGGVVPVINLEDYAAGGVRLTGKVLADIYMGKIAKWNASEIAELNPEVKLPDLDITVVHRSDGSGTTFIFTNYLSRVSPEWKEEIGSDAAVSWPVGVGGKGNEGVASYVQRIAGSIGYVEYAYALQNKMNYCRLRNHDGVYVRPEAKNFQAAAANADWASAPGFYQILTDEPGEDSWPITGATFILMHENQKNASAAVRVLHFFRWAYNNGDDMAAALDYIPMPDNVVILIYKEWSRIKGPDNKPVLLSIAETD